MKYLKLSINDHCLVRLNDSDHDEVVEYIHSIESAIKALVDDGICEMELVAAEH